jgi:hypothetical protein
MNNPAPSDNQDKAMEEALRRDAARIEEPPFDAALHHATMRRLRALAEPSPRQSNWWWRPALAGAAAVAVVFAILTRRPTTSQEIPAHPVTRAVQPDLAAVLAPARAAVATVRLDPARTMPSWMSPTTSLLESPGILTGSLLSH